MKRRRFLYVVVPVEARYCAELGVDNRRRRARRLGMSMEPLFKPGQLVRVNLAGMQVASVTFHAAVTDAVGNIVKQTSENPSKYLVRLLFSFRGINEVEVSADRIRSG